MRILVLGSGAREHALCWRLGLDRDVSQVVCAPGNAGIARSIDVAPVVPTDPDAVLALARRWRADLTIVGPEGPLAAGIADRFAAAGVPLFGPTRAAARLETSKAFAKSFMAAHGVPTARHRVCHSAADALGVVGSGELGERVVVKADGLAAGKGVVVAPDRRAAEAAIRAAMVDQAFGDAGAVVVLEECLTGPEVSFFVVADGESFRSLLTAQDHKRIFDDDLGPNTGGMGAFAPSPLVDARLQSRIEREIVQPVLTGLVRDGAPFRGFLYCGLMLTEEGPRVIEFNVRFGDPEAQVVLPLIDAPLAPLLLAAAQGRLGGADGGVSAGALSHDGESSTVACAVGVVLAAGGYPGEVQTGRRIEGLDHLAHECPDVLAFFAGVRTDSTTLVTSGGRVMTLVARDRSYQTAMTRAYEAVSRVRFDGMQFRRDIGRKALRVDS
ncbi:MAG TPA: phosphoribosylamine--glycine ligase [Vicinamibacterales bacterium]|nr:phosphoribosylamine--glycine ligase [Vicinamibacterales bacterium]